MHVDLGCTSSTGMVPTQSPNKEGQGQGRAGQGGAGPSDLRLRPLAPLNALRNLAEGFATNAWSEAVSFTPVGWCPASRFTIISYTRTDTQGVN